VFGGEIIYVAREEAVERYWEGFLYSVDAWRGDESEWD